MPYFATPDRINLFYEDWGTGRPVVLIHGWPLTADMWEYQTRPLAEQGNRVITYDRRGFGRSDHPWGSVYDYDHLADDLASLIEGLDLRDVAVVGFSMGGGEAVRYVSRHGTDRVRALALVSSITPMLMRTPSNPDGADPAIFAEMIDALEDDRPKFMTDLSAKLFGDALSPEMVRWIGDMGLEASPQATIATLKSWSETDFRPDMGMVTIPTLVVHGDADASVPIDMTARKAVKALPNGRLEVYGGAPHGIPLTHRARLAKELLDFLRT